jgi:tRNA pseudouridine38-40 synthase
MSRLKLTIEYDGTEFVGWQRQPNGRSVQETFEAVLEKLLGAATPVEAAGRTDAGVHAAGQVVAFSTERALPLKAYTRGLNGMLPGDISVRTAEEVSGDFDPRRSASGKRYAYRISNRSQRSALLRRTHWELFAALDLSAMQAASASLVGTHDFSAFRASNCEAKHAVRTVHRVDVAKEGEELWVDVRGTAFLKHMVRNIVGTLVEVGRGRQPPEWVARVLASGERTQAGPTAPAHGLTLMEVEYVAREPLEGSDDDE